MEPFDFVAIGDITTDAFIRLKEASVHCDINRENCQICMNFADKVPYESVTVVPAVGNSPNAAVAAARLGLKSALITNLGDDEEGDRAMAALTENKVDTRFVARHSERATNYHYVLWYEDERTILIKHQEYPYALPGFGEPRWVYLSSLGAAAGLEFYQTINRYLNEHPAINLAFQPGTYQIKLDREKLAELYRRAAIIFCNVTEAKKILGQETDEIKKLLEGLGQLGPKMAVITDGPKGAYAYHQDAFWFMPTYPDPKPPLERTGAGDAFAATVTAALAIGLPLSEALRWGPVNSMSVVQQVGAQAGLLGRQELEGYLTKAPDSYLPEKI